MKTEITLRELNWLVVNTVLAAAAIGVAIVRAGRIILVPSVPEAVLFGGAVFAIGATTYPIASIFLRQRRGREIPWIRHLLGSIAGGCVAAVVHLLLS